MKVLVVGGTGTVGRYVTRGLAEQGEQVRVLNRTGAKLAPDANIETVQGELEKPSTLAPAFEGVDAVFLLTPVSQTETAQGLNGVEAARKAGAKRIVQMSVMMPPGSEHIPHFASKLPVEQAVKASGLEWTILRPNSFMQNDLRLKDAVTNGVYPQPIGNKGVMRIDVRDIADAAIRALTTEDHAGSVYTLAGPRAWTGEETARVYSENLERPVRYAGDDLDAWASQASSYLPSWAVKDLRTMYAFFQEHGFNAMPEELENERRILGHDPRGFETFAWEVARGWRSAMKEVRRTKDEK